MAQLNHRNIKIIRHYKLGRLKVCHNIVLKHLPPRYRRILKENRYIKKHKSDDNFLLCLFALEDEKVLKTWGNRWCIDRKTGRIMHFKEMVEDRNYIDWNCAYCNKDIKSKIGDHTPKNFTCEDCFEYYGKRDFQMVSQKIIDESVRFTEYIKRRLLEDQKKYQAYIRKTIKNKQKSSDAIL